MKLTSQTHPIYIKACKREAEFRDGGDAYAEVVIPPRVFAYENKNRTGDANMNEFAYLKSLGKFPRGLSLGSGGGTYELKLIQEGIVDHFVFMDLSQTALTTLRANAERLGLSDKIETHIRDFNFFELPENTYDLVSCQNMLHHIVNLEECMHMINRSLTTNGIFVTNECIGENKMYWPDSKMALFHTIQALLTEQGIPTKEYIRTNPEVLTNNCPFECIRSADLYGVIDYYFGETAIRHIAYGHLQHAWNGLTDDTSDTYFDLLELFDAFAAENKLVKANRLYGIYKKSDKPLMESTPWSEEELKKNIGVKAVSERSLMVRGERLKKRFPKVYNVIKRLYFKIR